VQEIPQVYLEKMVCKRGAELIVDDHLEPSHYAHPQQIIWQI